MGGTGDRPAAAGGMEESVGGPSSTASEAASEEASPQAIWSLDEAACRSPRGDPRATAWGTSAEGLAEKGMPFFHGPVNESGPSPFPGNREGPRVSRQPRKG